MVVKYVYVTKELNMDNVFGESVTMMFWTFLQLWNMECKWKTCLEALESTTQKLEKVGLDILVVWAMTVVAISGVFLEWVLKKFH